MHIAPFWCVVSIHCRDNENGQIKQKHKVEGGRVNERQWEMLIMNAHQTFMAWQRANVQYQRARTHTCLLARLCLSMHHDYLKLANARRFRANVHMSVSQPKSYKDQKERKETTHEHWRMKIIQVKIRNFNATQTVDPWRHGNCSQIGIMGLPVAYLNIFLLKSTVFVFANETLTSVSILICQVFGTHTKIIEPNRQFFVRPDSCSSFFWIIHVFSLVLKSTKL